MSTVTRTRTHVFVDLSDPYLTCDHCRAWVPRWHDPQRCGCGELGWQNQPCGHQAGATTVCPSWGPVDGCQCIVHLGVTVVKHAVPPDAVAEGKLL